MPDEKCEAVLAYIRKVQANPPPMSFEVELPFLKVLEDITEIITNKTPLEKAYEQAKHTGSIKQLLKVRKDQS